jgi:serine/threonine-protein kinase RsbT
VPLGGRVTMMASFQPTGQLSVQSSSDAVRCVQLVRRVAETLQFTAVGKTMLATAASELARNTIIYGGSGLVEWEVIDGDGYRAGVRLTFTDHGPGIPDIELAMTDGWSSGHGMGLGLTGAKRLVHEFSIHSVVGTRVTVTRWKDEPTTTLRPKLLPAIQLQIPPKTL